MMGQPQGVIGWDGKPMPGVYGYMPRGLYIFKPKLPPKSGRADSSSDSRRVSNKSERGRKASSNAEDSALVWRRTEDVRSRRPSLPNILTEEDIILGRRPSLAESLDHDLVISFD